MFVVIWEYEVRPGSEASFEKLYGAEGEWVALFRKHAGFVGTELLRGDRPDTYLSIDRWESEAQYDDFLSTAGDRYARIDAMGDALTLDERRIGRCVTC
jgi:heme-degrading monooxygenase HmoA